MSAIHFVRHGRTVHNEQRRTQGSSDSPLTPEGRRGARATAEHLGRLPLVRAYLSPQGRVGRTADILLAGRPDVERTTLDGLREYDYGIYDGGPDEVMLRALDPARHLPGVLSGAHPGAPGGIGAVDYLAHVDAALARIVADLREDARAGRPDARVLVVSHGMTLMTLLGRWVGVEIFSMAPMANCSVTTVELDPDRPREPTLVSWAVDPGGQGVTFETRDMADAFAGVVPVPIDWSHPQEPV